jgi:NitT/TauT family transport system permease protein
MATPPVALFCKVILPGAAPSIIAGVRISAARAIIILITAEMLGAQSGLGFLIFDARNKFAASTMYSGILVLTILGMTINYLLVVVEKHATKWKGRWKDVSIHEI